MKRRKRKSISFIYGSCIYCLSVNQMRQYSLLSTENGRRFMNILQDADLVPAEFNLVRALRRTFDYIRSISIEPKLPFDPHSGAPTGLSAKISLNEPSSSMAKAGVISIDDLFELAQKTPPGTDIFSLGTFGSP
jgi:hypothetical protein